MNEDFTPAYQIAVIGDCEGSPRHAKFVFDTMQNLTRNLRTQFRVSLITASGSSAGSHAIAWADSHQFTRQFVPAPMGMTRWQARQAASMLAESYSAVVFVQAGKPRYEAFRGMAAELGVNLRVVDVPETFTKNHQR